MHGGGMVAGSRLTAEPTILRLVAASGITIITPEYRLAPEHPNPTPVHDCHAALAHLGREASGLGIDPLRLAIGGDSAGGGLAAATAILARDTGGPRLTAQLLGCPMLDDRTTGPREKWHTWTPADNAIGWSAYLGGAPADHLAAPARAADLGGLPRAFIDTGTLDLFCAEDVRYALRLLEAGVPCDLHVYAGAPHGFASLNPHAGVAKRALAQRAAFLRTI
nr:alpha/beta hydrolase [Tessaracoccus coleopterorum]